ncbi:MAG TPA: FAD binding domain-containing protein [Stellaceae bacterium]|jgi:CO/xanthine dehydrogenase FAD-binding subunit|nr:FAD binding domain-containing protein [Stellaceae bacterium]
MKPAPFDYVRPDTVAEVCTILAGDENARIIAGGQTLVPMLAMRLARPTRLIDVLRLPGLSGIRRDGDAMVFGAATRQVEAERSAMVAKDLPLLSRALPWVGHPPTRNRGTVGGSIANADPSAEIPLVAVTLEAELIIEDTDGEMPMAADDFFMGPMFTAMPLSGCLTAVRFPIWQAPHLGVGFHEVSARKSDFAFVSAAAQVALDEEGICTRVALGIGGVGDRAMKLDVEGLVGSRLDAKEIDDAVATAVETLEATSDLHASASYRQRVARALGAQAVISALADARKHEGRP